jgi:hypothetical protein
MGINSTEVAYGFGQLGSGFVNTIGAFEPPTGKVIVAIQFLADTELSGLVADTSQIDATPVAGNTGFFSHTAPSAVVHGIWGRCYRWRYNLSKGINYIWKMD